MITRRLFTLSLLAGVAWAALAQPASVDTLYLQSRALKRTVPALVISPAGGDPCPTLFLLHGATGNYTNWLERAPEILSYAEAQQIRIVCPDGGAFGWYLDSPMLDTMQYETYFSEELLPAIDSLYPTLAVREKRAIAGLSMGGHGAWHLALRHPNLWGAAFSMSGGLDLRPFPNNWELPRLLGPRWAFPQHWQDNSVAGQLYRYRPGLPVALWLDCGKDDFFLEVNRQAKQELDRLQIPYTYLERPGGHNWEYWRESLQYIMVFLERHFRS